MTSVPVVDGPGSAFRKRAAEAGLELSRELRAGPIHVDLDGYAVTVEGRPVALSASQIELCAVFIAAPHRVWSRDELAWLVDSHAVSPRGVDIQLTRIRARIGRELFRAVPRRGWVLDVAAPPRP